MHAIAGGWTYVIWKVNIGGYNIAHIQQIGKFQ